MDLDPYDYAGGNPVTDSDPSGQMPAGAYGTCSTSATCPSVAADDAPVDYGSWGDFLGGAVGSLLGAESGAIRFTELSWGDVQGRPGMRVWL